MTDWNKVAAIAASLTTAIALAAASIGLTTYRAQRTASDIQISLELFGRINDYWDKMHFGQKEEKSTEFFFGQVLTYFESACFLFNRGLLTRDASKMLEEHITEVWLKLNENHNAKDCLNGLLSSPSTFAEIKRYTETRKLNYWGRIARQRQLSLMVNAGIDPES